MNSENDSESERAVPSLHSVTTPADADDLPAIELQELRRRLADGSISVVDVLPAESWREGHIPGALSLPVATIPAQAREALPDTDRDIVVYCASDT